MKRKKKTIETRLYDGFAFYIDQPELQESVSLSLDVNIWVDDKSGCYIDFGILLASYSDLRKLVIYIPFSVESQEINDLYDCLAEPGVAQAVFNDDLYAKNYGKYIKLMDKNGQINRIIMSIGSDFSLTRLADNTVSQCDSGVTMRISPSCPKELTAEYKGQIYIRFRLPYKQLDQDMLTMRDYRGTVTTPFFRCNVASILALNERRNTPRCCWGDSLEYWRVGTIHYAIVANDIWHIASNSAPYRVRTLERNWSEYLPWQKIKESRRLLVYQYESLDAEKTTLYTEYSKQVVNARSILFYCVALLFFGILSEILNRLLLPPDFPHCPFG